MKIKRLSVVLALVVISLSGCASGPIGRFFRGGACNTCLPARPGLFNWRGNTASLCETPACQGHSQINEVGTTSDLPGGYGMDPFGSAAPIYGPVNPPNAGRLPGPTGNN